MSEAEQPSPPLAKRSLPEGFGVASFTPFNVEWTAAKYGPSMRHPLCMAALRLWARDQEVEELRSAKRWAESAVEALEENRALAAEHLDRSFREVSPDAVTAANEAKCELEKLLKDSEEMIPGARQFAKKIRERFHKARGIKVAAEANWARESSLAILTHDFEGFALLARAWEAIKGSNNETHRGKLLILNFLRDRAVQKAGSLGSPEAETEVSASYFRMLGERASGWPCVTRVDLYAHLSSAGYYEKLPSDPIVRFEKRKQHLKDVARLAKNLGVQLSRHKEGRPRNPKRQGGNGVKPKRQRCTPF